MELDLGVGREVKRLREAKDWSQAKLAVEAGMSVSGVSMIENGHRNLSTATLAKLAQALDVGIGDFFPKGQEPLPEAPPPSGPPRVSKERLEEHFENIRPAEVTYLDLVIADLWRLALPDEKPQAHFVPEDIDTARVWEVLNFVLTTPGMFVPEQVERINRGARKLALVAKG
jgi:transcriptional regulator with XRE-family HTH domain